MDKEREQQQYIENLKGIQVELPYLLDAVSDTQKKFFENQDSLQAGLDMCIEEIFSSRAGSELAVWVIGCGQGEEAYSVAMMLNEHPAAFDFHVLGTDISEDSLEIARRAIYDAAKIKNVPLPIIKNNFLRSRQKEKDLVRVAPEVRNMVAFRQINYARDFTLREQMDIVVCRNTLFYFHPSVQEVLLRKFCEFINPGGFFISGNNEDFSRMRVPLLEIDENIYRRDAEDD
ncbi:MAG: CheR family methyltransferase [Desulfovibrionales bacterium]